MSKAKKKTTRARKVTTKTVVLEVETTATADALRSMTWEEAILRTDPRAKVRQVTVQVADRTK